MIKFELKKCLKCGALVEVLEDCSCENCGIKCCGEKMTRIETNIDSELGKNHIPHYEVEGNEIVVSLNHVMEAEHLIKWIAMVKDNEVIKKYLDEGDAIQRFPYVKGSYIYAYCNKHGLWETKVE